MKGSIQKRTTKQGETYYLVRAELPADSTTGKRRQRAKAFPTKKAAETALALFGAARAPMARCGSAARHTEHPARAQARGGQPLGDRRTEDAEGAPAVRFAAD
jgi:hypothetical protein